MSSSKRFSDTLHRIGKIPAPRDYFAETRGSGVLLNPEKILCFARRSKTEADHEALHKHHHHRYVLVVPMRGKGKVVVDDCIFKIGPGESLLIFPFQFHYGFDFYQQKVLWLFITFEIKNAPEMETLRLNPCCRLEKGDRPLLSSFVDAWLAKEKSFELSYWLGLLLSRIYFHPLATKTKKINFSQEKSRTSLLIRINQQCLPVLDQAIGIKELAGRLAISESYLRSSFRKETGMSLGQHLRRLRMQKAIGLLLQSNLTVSQISEKCGFDSVFTFCRAFRRFTGMRAGEYRARFSS